MESVVALFPDPAQARQALSALQARGFERERLGFALADVVAENDIAQATGVSPEAGAPGGSGTVIKGTIYGTVIGILVMLPVWGLLLAIPETRIYSNGALMAMLLVTIGTAGMGLLFGALAGSDHGDHVKLLRRMGVPAAQAERFGQGIKNGQTLVIARDPDGSRADEALSIMRRSGAVRLEDVQGGGKLQSERDGQNGH
ncbi:hypothetical protein [Deinococcus wulumuqiensis]|uniref:hypothetical protein n=1 Tax=Deinococcus wulumuqiensis TaxID=980427 RepID=UPI0024331B42|nr:hypothetical protein [Deinococcus wulumuqiensis]